MVKTIATILLILTVLVSEAQFKQVTGKTIEINGWTLSNNTNDTLTLVAIEIFNGNFFFKAIRSDINGYFSLLTCSNELIEDSLTFKVLYPDYLKEKFVFHHDDITNLKIKMSLDSNKSVDIAEYKNFCLNKINNGCPDFRTPDWKPNLKPTRKGRSKYRHYCTGEIKTYNDLAVEEIDFSNWIEIKN